MIYVCLSFTPHQRAALASMLPSVKVEDFKMRWIPCAEYKAEDVMHHPRADRNTTWIICGDTAQCTSLPSLSLLGAAHFHAASLTQDRFGVALSISPSALFKENHFHTVPGNCEGCCCCVSSAMLHRINMFHVTQEKLDCSYMMYSTKTPPGNNWRSNLFSFSTF